jgi:DNA-binding helix-hairpin-helix protein with protein kinase domain
MNQPAVSIGGKAVSLSRRIGRGGEGDVFLVANDATIAVKLYTVNNLEDRAAKIKALVEARLAEKEAQVAFPLAEVRSLAGQFLGFAMRLVQDCKPLHELYAPGARKIHFPQADYRFLVRAASNVARAVAAVHRNSCVIGDINHSGLLVSPKAVVTLIDADSFQVCTPAGNFLCKVGVPEYTPPELQGASLAGVVRTANHDAFGLAVVIFQLLFMGRHPFVGTVRKGDIPPIHENIAARRYVYTDIANVGMDQPPGTPSLVDFYPPLATSFDQAFLSKEKRPTAEEWVRLLDKLEQSLVRCQDNELHYLPRDASECAWCDMERQLGTYLFLPFVPHAAIATGQDPGAGAFDLDGAWRTIQAIKSATDVQLSPKLKASSVSPSEAAKKAKAVGGWNGLGVTMVLGAIVGLFAAPKAIFLWAILFFWGISVANAKKTFDAGPFKNGYIAYENDFQKQLVAWNKRNGVDDFVKLFSDLEAARDEYLQVKREESREIASRGEQRKAAQLDAYLATFPIEHANIQGIGPATRATLASYGIDTAANVKDGRIQNVPGVGNKLSERLLAWRRKLEAQFVFRPDTSALDQSALLQARVKAETRLGPLRAKLIAGPQNLSSLAARMRQITSSEDTILAKAAQQRDQAKCDLQHLGIPIPYVAPAPAPQAARPPSVVGASASPQCVPGSGGSPTHAPAPASRKPWTPYQQGANTVMCPRCSQPMVKRLAKRGKNAGSYFWGCSRYPTCRGTRNI